jgi:hypothetical protein
VASWALVTVGGVVPLVVWCIASPWTFAAALAGGCWACGSAGRTATTRVGRRLAEVSVVDVGHWQLLRLLPALAVAAVGWGMLAGAAGAALLLVDAILGLPILIADRLSRGASSEESSPAPPTASSPVPTSWPGPRTLLPDLDDDELQHAWDSSTRALDLGPEPAALLRIVAARARYLDALDERDPDGLARRLAMGERDHWTSFDSPA